MGFLGKSVSNDVVICFNVKVKATLLIITNSRTDFIKIIVERLHPLVLNSNTDTIF